MTMPIYDESHDEKWENGVLGADENFVKVAEISSELEAAFDKATKMTMISIRLQDDLINDLKELADIHNIGYQPMIRQLLKRWVAAERKILAVRNEAMQLKVETECCEKDPAYKVA